MAGDLSVSGGKVHTPLGDAPVLPLLIIMVGGYLAWFGIHYWRSAITWPSDPLKSFLQGNGLTATTTAEPVSAELTDIEVEQGAGVSGGSSAGAGATGNAISDAALKYDGDGYVFGGPASTPNNGDCSSWSSRVLGKDCGHALPGGGHWGDPAYPPHVHGPTTISYMLYGQRIERTQVKAGDLIVWNTHMGIAISNTEMISAQDPQLGIGKAKFDGAIPGETPHYRRVTA